MFGWLKRRREKARRQAAWPVGFTQPATSARSSLPGDSLDALIPLHPLSPIYGGHAAPDTSVCYSHDGGTFSSDGGTSSSSDSGSSGGSCD